MAKFGLQAHLGDILLEVLRRLAPDLQLPEERVLHELDSLLACNPREVSPSRQYLASGSGLSANSLRPNSAILSSSISMHFQHDCS